jgi:HEPN domain-containing protein
MPRESGVELARLFAAKARMDLSAAEILARSEGDHADVVCFHCQQAVEKMLKAAILAAGGHTM